MTTTWVSYNNNGNTVSIEGDAWVCTCGNTPDSDGFFPCNNYGHEVEPTPDKWDGSSYVCGCCELVFDMNTGRPHA